MSVVTRFYLLCALALASSFGYISLASHIITEDTQTDQTVLVMSQ